MAFWRTWSWDASAIDTILEGDDVTVERLMNEDDIVTEIKTQNKKLVEFFTEKDNLSDLITYITEPHEELTDELQYRYPYIACEVLCTDIYAIYELIFSTDELLNQLIHFWYSDPPLNHLLAGYVNRVFSCFLAKRKPEIISALKGKDDFLDVMLDRIETTHVVDLLVKLIATDDAEVGTIEWMAENNLISKAIAKLENDNNEVTQNISQLLSSIIVISNQGLTNGGDTRLLQELENEETISKLFDNILASAKSPAFLHGSAIITELIRNISSEIFDFGTSLDDAPAILKVLAKKMGRLNEFLLVKPDTPLNTTFGVLKPPFGMHRMKVLEIIGMSLHSRYFCIYNSFMETPLLNTLVDLFFEYHWNNFLHAIVNRVLTLILETNNSDLCLKMVVRTQLHTKLAECGLDDINSFNNDGYQRRGYMGFVTSLTSALEETAGVNEDLANILGESEEWQEFLSGSYADSQEIESKPLGGVAGAESSDDDEEEDQLLTYQQIVKRDFENEFPKNFSVGDFEDPEIDSLLHPLPGTLYEGIICQEQDFGNEFESDDEDTEDESS